MKGRLRPFLAEMHSFPTDSVPIAAPPERSGFGHPTSPESGIDNEKAKLAGLLFGSDSSRNSRTKAATRRVGGQSLTWISKGC